MVVYPSPAPISMVRCTYNGMFKKIAFRDPGPDPGLLPPFQMLCQKRRHKRSQIKHFPRIIASNTTKLQSLQLNNAPTALFMSPPTAPYSLTLVLVSKQTSSYYFSPTPPRLFAVVIRYCSECVYKYGIVTAYIYHDVSSNEQC